MSVQREWRMNVPTAYGYTFFMDNGMSIELASKHSEWVDEAKRRLNTHAELVAALQVITAFTDAQMKGTYYACAGEMQAIARAALTKAGVK